MRLGIKERIVLRGLLPEKGDFLTYKTVRELHEMLAFDEEEIEKFSLTQEDKQITWDAEADLPREFTFTKAQRELIEKTLAAKSEANEINEDTFSLCEKFLGE